MSRTSASQFEVMVEFMERNGDLNKFTEGPHGRVTAHNKWVELARVLNLDATGSSKTVDKWKKVWSDYKNNIKRKAAKIHRSASGTGGGPACRLVLSDLEQRVLNLTATQAATGLRSIAEVGVEFQGPPSEHDAEHQLPPPQSPPATPAQLMLDSMQVESMSDNENRPGPSREEFHVEEIEGDALSPTPHHASVASPRRSGAGTRRVIRPRRTTPRRRRPPPPDAASHFLASEQRWQNFAIEFATEHLRLREREIEQQWQTLFAKFIMC